MKLWQKHKSITDARIEDFTVGLDREMDLHLAYADVLTNMAHSYMLGRCGLMEMDEAKRIHAELKSFLPAIESGQFRLSPDVEDIHSQIEAWLTDKFGETGKKIHTARSRNDQVLTDLKIYLRHEILELGDQIKQLGLILLDQADRSKKSLIPGYTHFQAAMFSSGGLWFSSFAENLADDLVVLKQILEVINQNPLGSGAGYGSTFAIDRAITTTLLGFGGLHINSIHAQLQRGKTEWLMSTGLAAIAQTISVLAYDLCLFNSQNFAFVELPENFTTGSSIMPHKRNPDVFELIRAKSNQLKGLPVQIQSVISNLPSGYHRDFQILKELLFPAITLTKDVLSMVTYAMPKVIFRQDILTNPIYKYLDSVNQIQHLVSQGMSFRSAYESISKQIQQKTYQPGNCGEYTHLGSLGNLGLEDIKTKLITRFNALEAPRFRQIEEALIAGAHFTA